MSLYEPQDIEQANKQWGANCGPIALAAILGLPVSDVRALLPGFEQRPYVNPTQMQAAIQMAGQNYRVIDKKKPRFGLAFIQWCGTWDNAPVCAQYKRTHWIGIHTTQGNDVFVFDANFGHWIDSLDWEWQLVPALTDQIKGANGKWYVRVGIETRKGTIR